MSIWFVTPAYGRFALTAVCLEQRHRAIGYLAERGVEAHCVVVADDENLDIARGFGFSTVERDNAWLGQKFNDGIEYACRRMAEFVVPIGSDSWIDPAYFLPMPRARVTRTSRLYCPVTDERLAECKVARSGAGPYVFHRSLLKRSGFRPAEDRIKRGVDGSTIRGIGQVIRWEFHDVHPLQYIGFRGTPHITSYDRLVERWGVRESADPWRELARHYDPDLVARARAAL